MNSPPDQREELLPCKKCSKPTTSMWRGLPLCVDCLTLGVHAHDATPTPTAGPTVEQVECSECHSVDGHEVGCFKSKRLQAGYEAGHADGYSESEQSHTREIATLKSRVEELVKAGNDLADSLFCSCHEVSTGFKCYNCGLEGEWQAAVAACSPIHGDEEAKV